MEAMLTHLETVLRAVAADPGLRLSQIPIVAGTEAEQLISAGRSQAGREGQRPARQVYVVDRSVILVPRGGAGELLIGCGPGNRPSRYLDQPELTTGTFIADPFCPGRLVYRSGDLARWSSDLRIEFLGGVDSRAELGEIEAALASHADVGRAVALVRPDPAEAGTGQDGGEPCSQAERIVAGIFGEVLSLPWVNVEDNFFDIGGNSLQVMRAASRINKAFGIKLSVRTLYGGATARAVSVAVDEAVADKTVGGKPA